MMTNPMQNSFADQLQLLIRLQEIDSRIYALKGEQDHLPKELEEAKAELERAKGEVQKSEEALKTVSLSHKEKDISLGEKESAVKKYQGQLFQVKTNKEYTALQKEIEGLKADASLLEEEILLLFEKIDAAKSTLAQEKQKFSREEALFQERRRECDARIQKLSEEIASLETSRKEFLPQVDPQILSRYERILKGKGGLAIVGASESACLGCHMSLPPQVINEIRMKTQIVTCEKCSRILYVESEPDDSE